MQIYRKKLKTGHYNGNFSQNSILVRLKFIIKEKFNYICI